MSCNFAKVRHCPFDGTVQRTTEALTSAGFGIITDDRCKRGI